jgi:hypothetical protein
MYEFCYLFQVLQEMGLRSISYAFACYFIQQIAGIVSPRCIPKFHILTDKDAGYKWFNRAVSFIHAIIMFLRTIYFWINIESIYFNIDSEYISNRVLSDYEAVTIDIMIGYLIFDSIFEMTNNKDVQLILAHHVAGLISHIMTRLTCCGPASYYR